MDVLTDSAKGSSVNIPAGGGPVKVSLTRRQKWTILFQGWWSICPLARLTELLGGITTSWWVFLIAQPGDLFATNPAFTALRTHGGEAQWGFFLSIAALLHIAAFLAGPPLLRFLALGVGSGVWGGVATLLASASPVATTGVLLNTGLGVYCGLIIVNTVAMTLLVEYAMLDAEGIARRLKRRRLLVRQPFKQVG